MDTSDTSSDLTDSQWHDIGECYLTNSQYEDLFSDWSKPENDCIQSDMEIDCSDNDCIQSDMKMDCSDNDCIQSDMKMDCSQSNASKKRKSSDSECSRPNKVRVIVANPQFVVGNNTEATHQERSKKASIIFRPWEDSNHSMEN